MASSYFKHTPLDRTIQSLRLVYLLPDLSEDGCIQCSIRHATISARYVCLSYRWGEHDPENQSSISIDGQPFIIQRNLLDFLQVMRSTAPRDDPLFDPDIGYWVDALCIDQSNTLERNHQVAQMGSIFSRADYVHVWLGKTPDAKRIRRLIDGPHQPKRLGTWADLVRLDMDFIRKCIYENKYWTRAWYDVFSSQSVVQEIVLAKKVEVSLDTQRFPFAQLVENARHFYLDWTGTHFEQFASHSQGGVGIRKKSLLKLLDRFQEKRCSLVHDRVFSLLGLCHNGADMIVLYNMSLSMLAYLTLRAGQEKLCICSARVVARNLGLGQNESLVPLRQQTFLEVELVDFKVELSTTTNGVILRLIHPDYLDEWRKWEVTPDDVTRDKGIVPGCLGHWLSHFAATLYAQLHLSTIVELHRKPGGLILPLANFLSDTIMIMGKQEQRSCPQGWSLLTQDILVQIPTWHVNLCTVKVPLNTLDKECSYQPRLCNSSAAKDWECPRSVALGIRAARAI